MSASSGFKLPPSSLPDGIRVSLEKHIPICRPAARPEVSGDIDLHSISAFQKAANYLALAQIYLSSNAVLEKPLSRSHIKKRLLGHWGTCPGLILAYTHLTALISRLETRSDCKLCMSEDDRYSQDFSSVDETDCLRRFLFVTGPGHGAPAVNACLYLEGSISEFYRDETLDEEGIERFVKKFSWPGSGRPSHVSATTPGSIHEGGELGYALSVAYGAVMDKPDLVAAVVVGDGEAETGPTATAWHAHKFIDPSESGAVLPILHLNRFKIAEPTIFGTMDKKELLCLFSGYGYHVRIVDYYDHTTDHSLPGDEKIQCLDIDMANSLEWALREIREIQSAARQGEPIVKPRWPMIILITPKGWGCPSTVDGKRIEGSYRSHQVPIKDVEQDDKHFQILEEWLRSYEPHKWFKADSEQGSNFKLHPLVRRMLPKNVDLLMGRFKEILEASARLENLSPAVFMVKECTEASGMDLVGEYLAQVIRSNPHTFRIFSPDELESNHLGKVFEVSKIGRRNFQSDSSCLLTKSTRGQGGRIIEMLSEHTLQGFCQGYALTGRTALFPSYESFLGIVSTMIEQFSKFIKESKAVQFRKPIASVTYIETSTLWRQEHNGFSHQNPGLINIVLNLPKDIARVYMPPDANCALTTVAHSLKGKDHVNLIVGSKHSTPIYLSPEASHEHCKRGGSIWPQYSTHGGEEPDIVLVGIGVETTYETIAAVQLLKEEIDGIRVRFVNITDLMILAEQSAHPHALIDEKMIELFTEDKPCVFNFHGYPSAVQGLLSTRLQLLTPKSYGRRVNVYGYKEEGTTTTPWSMLRLNGVDRFTVAQSAARLLFEHGDDAEKEARTDEGLHVGSHKLVKLEERWEDEKRKSDAYAREHGEDPASVKLILENFKRESIKTSKLPSFHPAPC
ncbi:D-xylulose 5-phosphate/D-fructose 6-phosphate phosphoketolase [Violaceomyces palustris]|uniref:D-xylulose 5-phosphate/D-fructose 6-phosphate phosphoketolase n=1 Tax=Violaceomyces palustris TaxID=1673888 RepID=A0ACD0P2E5_9BASI|nr:D-xylulose 5-phosphate/D-fructose 6-phosphate phosphoketolase [Violaceomyces palustris]